MKRVIFFFLCLVIFCSFLLAQTPDIKALTIRADKGDADAQYNVGCCYYRGLEVPQDYAKAVEYYQKAADQGNAKAQSYLGYCYYCGAGVSPDYAKAVEWYQKAANQGDAMAQNNLGDCYYNGQGVLKDYKKAIGYYQQAANQGFAAGQYNVGYCYYRGLEVPQDYAKAVEYYQKAADQGNAKAQSYLGYCYYCGAGVSPDYAKAVEWYQKAVNQGDAMAQNNLGDCYYNGQGVLKDYEKAIEYYQQAANQDFVNAQYNLGNSYYNGEGVPKDYAKAVAFYQKAADQGLADAQNNLGYCYKNGFGVSQDYVKAVEWYQKAARQGEANAQNNLGACYYNGFGVSADYVKAVEWYQKAALQGNANAQNNLGVCYYNGFGVSKDYEKAMKWYRQAADQGEAYAQYHIGFCYEKGKGVKQNDADAYYWYQKSAEQGNEGAKMRCDNVAFVAHAKNIKRSVPIFDSGKPPILNIIDNNIRFVDANGNNIIDGNESCKLRFRVKNTGKGDAVNCIAKISGTGNLSGLTFSNIELPVIVKGSSIEVEIPIMANTKTVNGNVDFKVSIYEPNGFGCDPVTLAVNTHQFEAPFVQVSDYSVTSQGGSMLNKRVPFDLHLLVQNVRHGEADSVTVSVSLPPNVLLMEGQPTNNIGKLLGGITKSIVYSLIVNNNYTSSMVPVRVNISERYGMYAKNKTINLQLNQFLSEKRIVVEDSSKGDVEGDIKIAQISGKQRQSDVDVNIVESNEKNANTFAVIIANEKYRQEVSVPYAQNDGSVFAEYCMKTLGLPKVNIHCLLNATLNDIRHEVNWLNNLTVAYHGQAKVILYYAGHGIPDEGNYTSYLMPVDAFGSDVSTCYKLSDLYEQLGKMPSKLITVFLDACFSGSKRDGGMLACARGVAIKAHNEVPNGNMVVFSAAQGDQTAYPYGEESHGIFTYYLLKELQKTKGEASLGDIMDYVTDNVSKQSIVINGKSQTPMVISSSFLSTSWRAKTLK